MKEHTLKTLPEYFDALADGSKTFEVRHNDRGFKTGDVLLLMRLRDGLPDGAVLRRIVSYVLPGGQFGIDSEYVVLGLKP